MPTYTATFADDTEETAELADDRAAATYFAARARPRTLFAVRRGRGRPKFYRKGETGNVAYPISARAAALEVSTMGTAP